MRNAMQWILHIVVGASIGAVASFLTTSLIWPAVYYRFLVLNELFSPKMELIDSITLVTVVAIGTVFGIVGAILLRRKNSNRASQCPT